MKEIIINKMIYEQNLKNQKILSREKVDDIVF